MSGALTLSTNAGFNCGSLFAELRRCRLTMWLVVPCGIATLAPTVALPQSTSTESADNQLAEIVVTAQKRPENNYRRRDR